MPDWYRIKLRITSVVITLSLPMQQFGCPSRYSESAFLGEEVLYFFLYSAISLSIVANCHFSMQSSFFFPLFLMFGFILRRNGLPEFLILNAQKKKRFICLDINVRRLQRYLIWKLEELSTFWKKPCKPENKRHATVKVFQVRNLSLLVFQKAFTHFPYVFFRHKEHKPKMTATFKCS